MLTLVLIVAVISTGLTQWRLHTMSEALDRLTREVQETRDVANSAMTLIAGLAEEIRNNVDDSDALNALADQLDASATELAGAVSANTPGGPLTPQETTPQTDA